MSDSKKNTVCYGSIIEKIKALDLTISELRDTIVSIKGSVSAAGEETTSVEVEEYDETIEELCLDEIESERAMLEIMKNACLESLHDQEPEGDA